MAIPERESRYVSDMLHWTWSVRVQLQRYSTALSAELKSVAGEDPRRRFSLTSFEEHVLVVAVGQLVKLSRRGKTRWPRLALSAGQLATLDNLRDAYEHWESEQAKYRRDTLGSGAVSRLAEVDPLARPWSVDLAPDGPVLAGTISVAELDAELKRLERALLAGEAASSA